MQLLVQHVHELVMLLRHLESGRSYFIRRSACVRSMLAHYIENLFDLVLALVLKRIETFRN